MEWCGCNFPAAECSVSTLAEFVPMIYELMLPLVNYIEEKEKEKKNEPYFPLFLANLMFMLYVPSGGIKHSEVCRPCFSAGKMQLFRAGSSI